MAIMPQQLVNAIGTTLIYSLGQGLILALLTALIVLFTRNRKPTTRYNLLTGAMAVFFFTNLAIFIDLISLTDEVGLNVTVNNASTNLTGSIGVQVVHNSLLENVQGYLQSNYQTVVLIWLSIVCMRCVQLSIGLNRLGYLRKKANFDSLGEWEQRIMELSKSLGIKKIVNIAESGLTKVPMVIGHFKPLILIPVGLLTALPPQQIEAILIHELAHVQRRDYLVNLLQGLMEILFFFNPAVLWLSALIKTERENCCDDMAIQQTSSKFNYISALVSCQEYQAAAPDFAMAFSRKTQLKNRVQRLVYSNNHSLNRMEKSILAVCIGLVGFGLLAFSNADQLENALGKPAKSKEIEVQQTDKSINATSNPVNQSIKDIKSTRANLELSRLTKKLDTDSVALPKQVKEAENKQLARLDSIQSTLTTLKVDVNLSSLKVNLGNQKREAKPTTDTHKSNMLGDAVTQEMLNDGIITQVDNKLSFKLSNSEFIVNGKPQSTSIHRKYREKYVPITEGKNTWSFLYNFDTSTKVSP